MIREATREDIPEILRLVHALARYEREPDAVEATPELYATWLFPPHAAPAAYVLLAEEETAEGVDRVVGMALWFPTFSTWTGRPGIWLEDLYVEENVRGAGHGRALMRELARICRERGWARLDWSVLRWNASAIEFYERIGAHARSDWVDYRMDGPALHGFAGGT